MRKSIRTKIVFIMIMLILLLMTVVLAFLIIGVQSFYTNDFYKQMETVFSNKAAVSSLRNAADEENAADRLKQVLSAYEGQLGINTGTRNFYILDGKTGAVLTSSAPDEDAGIEITANIVKALQGETSYKGSSGTDFMDVAVPIVSESGAGRFVVYIIDNKQTAQDLNAEIFTLILEAVLIGFAISVVLSVILSGTMLSPIRGMTAAASAMAGGDFSAKIAVESGDEIGVLSDTFNDMGSQLENTLEQLKTAEKLRRDFVANVSHELRTPITSIRSYAETLEATPDLPKETEKEFLNVIINESDRMTKIVQDLLELSRFDSGHLQLELDSVSIERSLRDVYAAIALEAKKRGHTFNLELEWRMPKIKGDKSRIEQVLMNIISNAVKYTPDGGLIDIFGGTKKGRVWVSVSDNGVGIPQEDISHVFDRFYRVDKARSRESGGTGLGLSIAKEIVSRHGGEIVIKSEPGRGTEVTIYLPIEGPLNEKNDERNTEK